MKDVDEYGGSLRILKRLKKAYLYRAEQARELSLSIEKSPYPVILCGDFNDTPVSYSYRTISKNLEDCYGKAGRGFWTTYAGPIPGLRIDFILHSPSLSTKGFLTQKVRLSDHYPVEAIIGHGS